MSDYNTHTVIPLQEGNRPMPFIHTPPGQERAVVRSCIRKAKRHLSKLEREILTWLTDRWFYHRGGQGVIYPGVKAIAKAAECSERTVRYVLKRLREFAVIVPVQYAKGGRNATRYMVDIAKILLQFGNLPKEAKGELKPLKPRHDRVLSTPEAEEINPAKIADGKDSSEHKTWTNGLSARERWRYADGIKLGLARWVSPKAYLNRIKRQKERRLQPSCVPF